MKQTPLRQGTGFAASPAQREAVAGHRCIVCGAEGVDPAHVVSRALGGCDEAACVVPLCRRCHGAYDEHRLNLLPHLEPDWREQLAHAVAHVGVVGALRRIAGPARASLEGSSGDAYAPPVHDWEARPRRTEERRAPTRPRRLASGVLSEAEVLALIAVCPSRSVGIRNRAMIATLWCCGPQLSELLGLASADVDLDGPTIAFGRGQSRRALALDRQTAALMASWFDCRRGLGIGDQPPVFCTMSGRPLDPSYLRHLLPRLARKAGIARRVHANGLRDTYAADLAREGAPIALIRNALGHASRSVTARYLRELPRRTPPEGGPDPAA
jgi:integrase